MKETTVTQLLCQIQSMFSTHCIAHFAVFAVFLPTWPNYQIPFSPAQEQLKLTAPGNQARFSLALPAKTMHVSSFTNSLSCILRMVFICIALQQTK